MEKIIKALSSRTVWMVILMFVVGGVHAITQFIPASLVTVIDGVLAFLAAYFKVNPSQPY